MVLDIKFKDARGWVQWQNVRAAAVSANEFGLLLTVIRGDTRRVEEIPLETVETFGIVND